MLHQQYCLRWKYHHSNLQTMFSQLLEREAYCDVGLVCEGRTIKAHKIVLCSCSTYFDNILSQYDEKYPIIIMQNVKFIDIKCLIEYMYKGEINVDHSNLPTLLKTAEELRIKGLAEVSWRDDDNNMPVTTSQYQNDTNSNGLPAVIPPVSTIMESPPYEHSTTTATTNWNKKKRNRDDYERSFTIPKVCHHISSSGNVSNVEDAYSNDALSSSDHNLQIWEEDQQNDTTDNDEAPPMKLKKEINQVDDDQDDHSNTSLSSSKPSTNNYTTSSQLVGGSSSTQSFLTPSVEQEWPDVIKMNEYLNTGRRQQFWEEPFTKRIMDAIKNKTLEMKVAAELLGVSYGTLYGRYRDSYGCLKHPYRVVREFGSDPSVSNDIASMLKRNDISCSKSVELLNVTPQALSNYMTNLSSSKMENQDLNSRIQSFHGESCDDSTTEDEADTVSNSGNIKLNDVTNSENALPSSDDNKTFLASCEDITIIKNELNDDIIKMNNNSDHSDSTSDDK